MATELSRNAVIKTYARWAPVYDVVFGSVFENARRMAVEASERVGGRILEVGVGTGISLPYYSARSRVVGIDISEPMLKVARRRVIDERLEHVELLELMDAENLEFPESSFDVVVAQYVVNTVPHPEIALDEFLRVLRPGGELVIVNRVGADGRLAQGARAHVPAHRAAARLAVQVSVGALRALGRPLAGGLSHRAPPGAAARPFLAHPLRQARCREPRRATSQHRLRVRQRGPRTCRRIDPIARQCT